MAKRKKKLTLTEAVINMTDEELNAASKEELQRYYRAMRTTVGKRRRQFEDENEFSYAIDYYDKLVRQNPNIPLAKMTLGRLRREIKYLTSALTSETITGAGARKVHREQDLRIFGRISGTQPPQRTMTNEERKTFWSFYNEWQSQYGNVTGLSSSQVQRSLADLMFSQQNDSFWGETFVSQLEMLTDYAREVAEEAERTGFMPNVFTGRGSDF